MLWILILWMAGLAALVIGSYISCRNRKESWVWQRYDGRRLRMLRYFVPLGYAIVRRLPLRYERAKGKSLYIQLQQMSGETDSRELYRIYLAQKLGIVLAGFLLCSSLFVISTLLSGQAGPLSRSFERSAYEEGDQYLQILATVTDGQEEYTEEIEFTVPEQTMSQEEKELWLGRGATYIQAYFQEQGAYDREPELPGTWEKAYYTYSSEEPEVIGDDGRLRTAWPQEETEVSFSVTVWVEDLHTSVPVSLRLAAARELSVERQLEILQQEIASGAYLAETVLVLPEQTVGGEEILWSEADKGPNRWLWLAGCALLLPLLGLWQDERLREAVRLRQERIRQAYPEMMNEVTILMGAGLTLQNAWLRITDKYQRRKEKSGRCEPLYEAMLAASIRMQNGLSFAETLREFGEQSRVKEVRKFAGLMLSDRKRGDEKLLQYLREMNEEAWEQKKKLVKEKTEEADTRLLLPLMMMLIVILVIVLAPAILTIRG